MKVLMKLFESELDKFLNQENFIDCKVAPQKLLRELKTTDGKKLIKALETQTTNPFKMVRMLSIANIIIIYSKSWFEVIEQGLKYQPTKDQWLNTKFLEPYYRFIIKCCTSKDSYNDTKNLTYKKSDTLQMLFYSINMLRQLFKVVQKMPLIGRYYKPKNDCVMSSAIQIIAIQAQRLYGVFKHSIAEILNNHKVHITNKEDQCIVKGILVDEMTYINEEMKKLFLDKYFYPLGKGISVKLFRPEQQSLECEKTYKSIVSNHQQTQRQKRKDELQYTLFPGSGLVNWNFYEQTLLSGPLMNVTLQGKSFMDLDEIAISEEDEQVQQIPLPAQNGKKQDQSQKETNSGTLQIKGHQM